jgi:hypothetical protein
MTAGASQTATKALAAFDNLMETVRPRVTAHNTNHVTEVTEAMQFLSGFKNGAVAVTGNESLYSWCNNNFSDFQQIYYINFVELLGFNPDAFTEVNTEATTRDLLINVQYTMQWPFQTLYSCYWAQELLLDPINDQDFPNLFNDRNEDGSFVKYNIYEQAALNLLFNLGYMYADAKWIALVETAEEDYYYRVGFAWGDFYMRIFFRSLYDVPVWFLDFDNE